MVILAIETSCDETAVSIVRAEGPATAPRFDVLANLVLSQVKIHEKFGGVFPAVARREHSAAIVPLIEKALDEAKIARKTHVPPTEAIEKAREILARDPDLFQKILTLAKNDRPSEPEIDMIAVTYGPGLEPALWVGLTAAQALGVLWNIPVQPIDHMEGHICSVLLETKEPVQFPALALLISGGHTELVLVKDWTEYEIVGETKDDAVGEAYDKVARMLGLPYPGGPQISSRAAARRSITDGNNGKNPFVFPRPMLNTTDFNFSFSGLKTSVLYTVKKLPTPIDEKTATEISEAFEDAVVEVLVKKTMRAAEAFGVKSLIIAGGVIQNQYIRSSFETVTSDADIKLFVPQAHLSTDNALMIALCAYIRSLYSPKNKDILQKEVRAMGNARISDIRH